MTTLDSSFASFIRIEEEVSDNSPNILTEEDTKLQIIHRILTESLGWSHAAISAERRHDNGYSDFVINYANTDIILLEAKRIASLNLTLANKSQCRPLKLNGPALSHVQDGIMQAAGYASPHGIPLAVLSDGLAWIVFKPYVAGQHFLSKEAYVFPGLNAIKTDFAQFHDLLSKDAIKEKRYTVLFDQLHNPRILVSQPLFAAVPDAEIRRIRKSELAFDLDRVFDTFFSRMRGDQDPDLLLECFVETRESRIADFSLDKMTRQVLGNIMPENKDVDQQLSQFLGQTVQQEEGESVFIVGPTGSGKTTFLDRFFKKTLAPDIRKKVVPLRVNFLDASGDIATVQGWMTEQIITAIETYSFVEGNPKWNDLLGLYFNEYKRRSEGVDSILYKRDPDKFRENFGEYMDQQVERNREGYLRRLLSDLVENRKVVPVIIVDNTDEFSLEMKKNIFQLAQALRRHAKHCVVIQPVTDKSAWSFANTDLFGIYSTKSFFLPTPPPREVFRKRIEYIKKKTENISSGKASGRYLAERGINISIGDLEKFATELETQFVNHERTARLLGEIANYNIRITLELARRVMTSAVFRIEDILASRAAGEQRVITWKQFMNALLRGDHELYRGSDAPQILNVFHVDEEIRQSPLLHLRVLALLRATADAAADIEGKHLTAGSIFDYFEVFGCTEAAMDKSMEWLIGNSLIEKFDPSVPELSREQRLAITHSGRAHLRLGLEEDVYFEQMALTTRIASEDLAEEVRHEYSAKGGLGDKMARIRGTFAKYVLAADMEELDGQRVGRQFDVQLQVDRGVERHALNGNEVEIRAEQRRLVNVVATVDWFSERKSYGFADCVGVDGQVFLHQDVLRRSGIESVSDGDDLVCSIDFAEKGPQVVEVLSVRTEEHDVLSRRCRVVRLFEERGYGFVRPLDTAVEDADAFFHFSLLEEDQKERISEGTEIEAEIKIDRRGRGWQVRKIHEIVGELS